ncbi:hypothetical protein EV189_1275 [Motilibacter rhizosphaerae]|uniref:Uncharacterized protein n=1 Tax=Motilibacter rhizosphaerae TaxID=598652 RepID=A0A4Q7NRV9_9ACTN|nr:hypothetical protein [Motilibacter rhizosphaerae]RZS89508.1 hypothetical protein EV189_1275 [Motilibacter rhizosphaerae]
MSEQTQDERGPLAGQAVRDWDGSGGVEGVAGEPAREGHLPADDAVTPSEAWHGAQVRDEIQQITDIELSGEQLTDEQRRVRAEAEGHAVDMEVRRTREGRAAGERAEDA